MDYLTAIVLGIIQGIFEWIPVSSEGMVTLAGKFFFGMQYQDALAMAIWLHTGTLIAALIYFRNDLIDIVKSIYTKDANRDLLVFLVITTIASAVTALPLIMLAFTKEAALVPEYAFTILIGLFLIVIAFLQKGQKEGKEQRPTPLNALIAGLVQGISVLPGLSRSGLTLATLMAEKYHIASALRLSFLMAIPVTFGVQFVLPLVKNDFAVTAPMLAGTAVAAVVGLITISWLLDIVRRTNFHKATLILGIIIVIAGILYALV